MCVPMPWPHKFADHRVAVLALDPLLHRGRNIATAGCPPALFQSRIQRFPGHLQQLLPAPEQSSRPAPSPPHPRSNHRISTPKSSEMMSPSSQHPRLSTESRARLPGLTEVHSDRRIAPITLERRAQPSCSAVVRSANSSRSFVRHSRPSHRAQLVQALPRSTRPARCIFSSSACDLQTIISPLPRRPESSPMRSAHRVHARPMASTVLQHAFAPVILDQRPRLPFVRRQALADHVLGVSSGR